MNSNELYLHYLANAVDIEDMNEVEYFSPFPYTILCKYSEKEFNEMLKNDNTFNKKWGYDS